MSELMVTIPRTTIDSLIRSSHRFDSELRLLIDMSEDALPCDFELAAQKFMQSTEDIEHEIWKARTFGEEKNEQR